MDTLYKALFLAGRMRVIGFESHWSHGCVPKFLCVALTYVGRGLESGLKESNRISEKFRKHCRILVYNAYRCASHAACHEFGTELRLILVCFRLRFMCFCFSRGTPIVMCPFVKIHQMKAWRSDLCSHICVQLLTWLDRWCYCGLR